MSKLPPRCPSATSCIHLASISPAACIHLVLYLVPPWPPKVPPTCASQQLPAFMRFQYQSFPPLVSPQLLACTVIWVQYLDFRFSSQQLLALILVSMSNFPLSHLPLSHQFSAVIWLQYLHVPPFLSTPSCMHLVSISKFPPPCASQQLPAFTFWSQNFPPRLWAILCMCLLLVSMASPLISQQLFNIELSLPPMCLSFSCVHFASYVDFPPLASSPLLTFLLFQYPNFPCINNFLHASCLSIWIPPTCSRSKKHVQVQKKNAPKSKNIQPSVSAYNNGVKVHEAGAWVQKTETEVRNN